VKTDTYSCTGLDKDVRDSGLVCLADEFHYIWHVLLVPILSLFL
jgi:hypothetical protein